MGHPGLSVGLTRLVLGHSGQLRARGLDPVGSSGFSGRAPGCAPEAAGPVPAAAFTEKGNAEIPAAPGAPGGAPGCPEGHGAASAPPDTPRTQLGHWDLLLWSPGQPDPGEAPSVTGLSGHSLAPLLSPRSCSQELWARAGADPEPVAME
ncbi:PREDICTED: cortexin-1 isoform X1 [Corvus brachyrhynchos]|uniref:cortexin-1 isoform X1 n=1 Tax=Corvus brachyrhynchos TaxID=85066 RepID=UPI00081659B0|nr:PREDICTED: cortexin-1 isoform X1 [Corvus brachyrhynchos]